MSENGAYSILLIAWKGVIRKLFRNGVLALAVSLLVALLVFALLFNHAVKEDLNAATKKLGADIVMVPVEAMAIAEEFILESEEKAFYMDEFVFESIRDMEEIKYATYQIYLNTLESGCCSIIDGQIIAIDQKTDFVVGPWLKDLPKLKEGESYVGDYVYGFLGLIDTATLFGQGIKVIGHLEETGTGLDHGVFIRVEDLKAVSKESFGTYKTGMISIIFIKLKEGIDLDLMTRKIQEINPTIGIMTRGTIGANVRATLKDIIRVFSITILISSILAILLAWSTFTAMANERKKEVGILRAIGARRFHIIKIFISEALFISVLGGVIGVVLGHYLIHYLAADFDLLSRIGAVTDFSAGTFLISLGAMFLGVFVCLIGALAPVIRLAGMEPLQAIKEV
jgi:putative ABC transport system permease protein